MSAQAMNTYIDSLVTDGTIQYGMLIGENINGTGKAIFGYLQFESIVEREVFLKPTVDGYTHLHIKKQTILEGAEYATIVDILHKISELEEKMSNISLIMTEGLPKESSVVSTYKVDKTNVIVDAWKEFIIKNPGIVDDSIENGLTNLLIDDINLNETEIANKNKVITWVKKLKARHRIEAEVGDIYDLHADLSKRVAIIERLAMRHYLDYVNEYTMVQQYKDAYTQIVKPQIEAIDGGAILDRADLLDTSEMITELSTRRGKIKDIVKEETID